MLSHLEGSFLGTLANSGSVANPCWQSYNGRDQRVNQDSDISSSQDFGSGLMKILPSDFDVSSIFGYEDIKPLYLHMQLTSVVWIMDITINHSIRILSTVYVMTSNLNIV